jgi:hypothetical protein
LVREVEKREEKGRMSATNAFGECFANVFDDNKWLEKARHKGEIFFGPKERKG